MKKILLPVLAISSIAMANAHVHDHSHLGDHSLKANLNFSLLNIKPSLSTGEKATFKFPAAYALSLEYLYKVEENVKVGVGIGFAGNKLQIEVDNKKKNLDAKLGSLYLAGETTVYSFDTGADLDVTAGLGVAYKSITEKEENATDSYKGKGVVLFAKLGVDYVYDEQFTAGLVFQHHGTTDGKLGTTSKKLSASANYFGLQLGYKYSL